MGVLIWEEVDTIMVLYQNNTMPGLSIRELNPEVLEALKRRAKRNHRSLHGEIHAILEVAASVVPPVEPEPLKLVFARGSRGDEADWGRGSIYDDAR